MKRKEVRNIRNRALNKEDKRGGEKMQLKRAKILLSVVIVAGLLFTSALA